jgi:biotin carboxyl carrier protein
MNSNDSLGSLNIGTRIYRTRISNKFAGRKHYQPVDPSVILSFIPGTVYDILIEEGKRVKKGDILMILDAMKMKNMLKSKTDGKVKSISVKKGDRVSKGTVLLMLE